MHGSHEASTSSQSLTSFCPSNKTIEAETQRAIFVAKHNIAFLACDHATKLFCRMFPDSETARKFSCGQTKATSLVKGDLAPHFLSKPTDSMSYPFSLMMDESNDKTIPHFSVMVT